jgi:CubicO group peptidase (beta-lactamase class C family)
VKNSTVGVKNVNSHSQYRIGSISKLFTVYTFLIEAGDVKFNDPITKYVPELAASARHEQNAVDSVDWESDCGESCESGVGDWPRL